MLEKKKLPLSNQRGWFKDGEIAVNAWIYSIKNRAVIISREDQLTKDAYIYHLTKASKKISAEIAVKTFDKLPPLPEKYPFENFAI